MGRWVDQKRVAQQTAYNVNGAVYGPELSGLRRRRVSLPWLGFHTCFIDNRCDDEQSPGTRTAIPAPPHLALGAAEGDCAVAPHDDLEEGSDRPVSGTGAAVGAGLRMARGRRARVDQQAEAERELTSLSSLHLASAEAPNHRASFFLKAYKTVTETAVRSSPQNARIFSQVARASSSAPSSTPSMRPTLTET
jgi:hypothetical protein